MTLAVKNTVQVYRIIKAQRGGAASFSDTGVEFPRVSQTDAYVHQCFSECLTSLTSESHGYGVRVCQNSGERVKYFHVFKTYKCAGILVFCVGIL